jgi:GNAT superfamily N-acetyltransferase
MNYSADIFNKLGNIRDKEYKEQLQQFMKVLQFPVTKGNLRTALQSKAVNHFGRKDSFQKASKDWDGYVGFFTELTEDKKLEFKNYPKETINFGYEKSLIKPPEKPQGYGFVTFSKDDFLGSPYITAASNSALPKVNDLTGPDAARVKFLRDYTASFTFESATVFDGNKPIASYNGGSRLVVDKEYRKEGIGKELVYQYRTRVPSVNVAEDRTKVTQAIQEDVWGRISRDNNRFDRDANDFAQRRVDLVSAEISMVIEGYKALPEEALVSKVIDSIKGHGFVIDEGDLPLMRDDIGKGGLFQSREALEKQLMEAIPENSVIQDFKNEQQYTPENDRRRSQSRSI